MTNRSDTYQREEFGGSSAERSTGAEVDHAAKDLDRLRQVMLTSIRRRCPRWLIEQSEDIVHEAMVRVLQISSEQPVGPGYWMRAAQNELIDEIRRRRASREIPGVLENDDTSWLSTEPGPERLYSSRQAGEVVYNCLQGLVSSRKQAVTLYLRGYSAKDSGKVLSWPVRRVQNLVFRGLRDLRECLDAKGVDR